MKIRRIEADYVALGIIAVCLLLIGLNEMFNPAKVIERAIDKAVYEYSTRETANTPFLNTDALDMAETDSATVKANLNITNGSAKGAGVDFVLDKDSLKNSAQAKFNLNYNGTAALGVNAYTDNENVTVSAPVLYEKNFIINIDEFSKRIYDAVGIQYDENEIQNIFFNAKAQDNTYNTVYNGISKGINASGRKAWVKVSGNVELSSIRGEELKDFDKGYELKITAEDTKTLYEIFGEELFSNSDFKNGITVYAENEYNSNPYMYMMYGIADSQALADILLESYENMYKQMTGTSDDSEMGIETGDTTIFVYINDGMLMSSQIGTFFTAQDQQLDINLNIDFGGEDNPVDYLSVKLSALSQGAGYNVTFNDSNSADGNKLTTNKSFAIDNTYGNILFNLNTTYDKENNGYTADFTMDQDDTTIISAASKGTIQSDKNIYSIVADSLNATVEETELLAADGSFSVVPLENEIIPIEGDAVDIHNVEEEERNSIAEEIQNKLTEIIEKMQG